MSMNIIKKTFGPILLAAFIVIATGCAESISIRSAPPQLPVYEQPICPDEGYIWVPGYWAYGANGYFWVPGIWEPAPEAGLLWTPGYWGWSNGYYIWHEGYWASHVGFYGGINYGHGYGGVGYEGGYWNEGRLYYNSAVTNVNVTVIHTTYQTPANENSVRTTVSYNGGAGGTSAKPLDKELVAARVSHVSATPAQKGHFRAAASNRELLVSFNQGRPRRDILAKRQGPSLEKKVAKQKKPLQNKVNEKKQKEHREYER